MLRVKKAKNARAKRALRAKEPKINESAKTAIFVRGPQTSNSVNIALSELHQLKQPNGVLFSKRNAVYPFEDASSLEFWSEKNDASLMIVGSHQKKRPNNLTFVRMFDYRVLDMLELGIENAISMKEFKTQKAAVGQTPLFHFSGSLFESDPRYIQFKSLILDTFRGEPVGSVALSKGIEHVISISHLPTSTCENNDENDDTTLSNAINENITRSIIPSAQDSQQESTTTTTLSASNNNTPLIHFRVYTIQFFKSGEREPRIELAPMGPFFDLRPRRTRSAEEELWKAAHRKPVEAGKGGDAKRKKARKNVDVDEMGDTVGTIHLGRQDLSTLQSRKMKGLKRTAGDSDIGEEDDDDDDDDDGDGGSDDFHDIASDDYRDEEDDSS